MQLNGFSGFRPALSLATPSNTGRGLPSRNGQTSDVVSFSGKAANTLWVNPQTVETAAAVFPRVGPPPLNSAFHADRRQQFLAQLPPNTTVILPGATDVQRNNDVTHPFRQESNFFYLTGIDRPAALAVLSNVPEHPQFSLVIPKRDPARETWVGKRVGTQEAYTRYGANKVWTYEPTGLEQQRLDPNLSKALNGAIPNQGKVQWLEPTSISDLGPVVKNYLSWAQPAGKVTLENREARAAVDNLRLIKTPWEIALLKRACQISADAHSHAMRTLRLTDPRQTLYEGAIQGALEGYWTSQGAVRAGYGTIAGGGKNGCVLHYVDNRDHTPYGKLALVDAGAEFGYQTADITRTWPVSGKFSPAQRAIYDIVLRAQEAGIRMVKPGVTMRQVHKAASDVLAEGLVQLGILKGSPEEVKTGLNDYFMHGTSHFLGMDVHDVPVSGSPALEGLEHQIPGDIVLKPGMVLTVEPGLYFDPRVVRKNGIDKQWSGIGIRIEDDILVTENGCENLSAGVPKKPEEIEALMSGQPLPTHAP